VGARPEKRYNSLYHFAEKGTRRHLPPITRRERIISRAKEGRTQNAQRGRKRHHLPLQLRKKGEFATAFLRRESPTISTGKESWKRSGKEVVLNLEREGGDALAFSEKGRKESRQGGRGKERRRGLSLGGEGRHPLPPERGGTDRRGGVRDRLVAGRLQKKEEKESRVRWQKGKTMARSS